MLVGAKIKHASSLRSVAVCLLFCAFGERDGTAAVYLVFVYIKVYTWYLVYKMHVIPGTKY